MGELGAPGRVLEDADGFFGDRGGVAEGDEAGCSAQDFGHCWGVGGDDGGCAGHGFERGQAEAFEEGGEDEGVGAGEEGGEVAVVDVAEEADGFGDAEAGGFATKGLEEWAGVAGEDEEGAGATLADGGEGAKGIDGAFAGLGGAEAEEVRCFEAVGGAEGGDACWVGGTEA